MAGDYTKFQRHYQTLTTDVLITPLTVDPLTVLTVRSANHQIFIQRSQLMVGTFAACVITLQGHTTGTVYARFDVQATPAPAGQSPTGFGPYLLDNGPTGLGCSIGESVDLVVTPVGMSGTIHIEAYQRLMAVTSSELTPTNQR